MLKELTGELKKPAIKKQFIGNVFLLIGYHRLTISRLQELSGCSQSTLSRLLLSKKGYRFDKTRYVTFVGIAEALGVDVYTLLFIDIRKKFSELLKQL